MLQILGCNQSASLVGNNVGKAMSNNPFVLYSLMGDKEINGWSNGSIGVESEFSMNVLISSTSLGSLGSRATKDEG